MLSVRSIKTGTITAAVFFDVKDGGSSSPSCKFAEFIVNSLNSSFGNFIVFHPTTFLSPALPWP